MARKPINKKFLERAFAGIHVRVLDELLKGELLCPKCSDAVRALVKADLERIERLKDEQPCPTLHFQPRRICARK